MFFFINLSSIICIARQHTLLLSSPRQLKTTLKVSQRKEALILCMCIYIYHATHLFMSSTDSDGERERERKQVFAPAKICISGSAQGEAPFWPPYVSLSPLLSVSPTLLILSSFSICKRYIR